MLKYEELITKLSIILDGNVDEFKDCSIHELEYLCELALQGVTKEQLLKIK